MCFVVPNGLAVSGIRLNLEGREPQGSLTPGPAADAFCRDLAAALLEIVDERTGAPLVRRVLRTAGLYTGECLDQLPDVLVEWNDEVATGSTNVGAGAGAHIRARSSRIGVIEHVNDYGRTGEHRPGGLFIAAGPGIAHGRLERESSIVDYAATFCTLLGVDPPPSDGQAIRLG
jgi:predicted AlkP superfamily phosphohydrolase/phosphomutase